MDIFLKDAEWMSKFKEAGVLRALPSENTREALSQSSFLAAQYPLNLINNMDKVEVVQFSPEKASYRMTQYADTLCIFRKNRR